MTSDADAAFIVADLIKDVLISHVRAKLYAVVYERALAESSVCGGPSEKAEQAMKHFDDAFPRQPISQESP